MRPLVMVYYLENLRPLVVTTSLNAALISPRSLKLKKKQKQQQQQQHPDNSTVPRVQV